MPTSPCQPEYPSYRQLLAYALVLGFTSFGGPASQIAMMHRELVTKRRWISESHFTHALNFCMLLPGPEAQQLATYLGWRLHGWRGGITLGGLFVLPSVFILLALSWLYMSGGHLPWIAALFHGLSAAVIALVAEALLRIGKKALRTPALLAVACASFIAIYFFQVYFALLILTAGLIGYLGKSLIPAQFPAPKDHPELPGEAGASFLTLPPSPSPTWQRAALITSLCTALWWLPILSVGLWLGWSSTPFMQGVFFSKAAIVTFGGAYAVLPYVAQQAVEHYQWLSHTQVMAGIALAETTPGPLIIVLQFVGFVGSWQNPGTLAPLPAALIGALITTWATFLPCFLFVFLGAPHVEHLRSQPHLAATLTTITAAVVGVILNLAIQFTTHALWPESKSHFDLFVAILAVLAFTALYKFKINLIRVIATCALAGLAWSLLP